MAIYVILYIVSNDVFSYLLQIAQMEATYPIETSMRTLSHIVPHGAKGQWLDHTNLLPIISTTPSWHYYLGLSSRKQSVISTIKYAYTGYISN